ncbi:MAG: Holliday junction branch migration protein RuvA [Gammaproteobacteria bacterium]
MIGLLRGTILDKQPPHLLLEVQGVGYELEAPMTTFYELPATGGVVTLYTHLAVREDAHLLYGFAKTTERDLFRHLLRVNGVGARLALTILSGMDAGAFAGCIQAGDTAALVRLPGVGRKTAERLVVEMRDRLDSLAGISLTQSGSAAARAPSSPLEDAVTALIGLGYKPQEASRMVRAIDTAELTSEEIIRTALQASVQ